MPSPVYTSNMLSDIEYAALGFETFHDDVLAPRIVEKTIPLSVEAHQCSEHLSPEEASGRRFSSIELGWRWDRSGRARGSSCEARCRMNSVERRLSFTSHVEQ